VTRVVDAIAALQPVMVIEGRVRINAQMRRSHKVESDASQQKVLYMYDDVTVPCVSSRCVSVSVSRIAINVYVWSLCVCLCKIRVSQ
jgi:hypothetical protein